LIKRAICLLLVISLFPRLATAQDSCEGNCTDGYGTLTKPNGTKLVSNFVRGQANGRGTVVQTNGDRYTFEFKNGVVSEPFTWYRVDFATGDVFEGDDTRGVVRFKDGRVYEGEMADGMLGGRGTMKFPNGRSFTGTWRAGKVLSGDWYSADGSKAYVPNGFSWKQMAIVMGGAALLGVVAFGIAKSPSIYSAESEADIEYRNSLIDRYWKERAEREDKK
jgi:hypothetical protein